jgi:cytochrome c
MLKKIILIAAFAVMSTNIFADGKDLYVSKGCGACHGADAKTPIMGSYPKISGQNKEYIAAQMSDIKSGKRSNGQSAAMKGVMAGVSEDDIKAISKYLAALK